jgi:hypothetical protein
VQETLCVRLNLELFDKHIQNGIPFCVVFNARSIRVIEDQVERTPDHYFYRAKCLK